MLIRKAVGRGSATYKYDLLTVLGTYALSQDKTLQRQTLRLICLITARYNWQGDTLSVGQEEIARLWSVDPRTVKREMAAFRARGWLIERRAAARGRVAVHGLGIRRILEDTRMVWERVGPDLVQRLDGDAQPGGTEEVKVIPFPQPEGPDLGSAGPVWGAVAELLRAEDAGRYRAWFAPLHAEWRGHDLLLEAPSDFHARYIETHFLSRIEAALKRIAPGGRVVIRAIPR
ncbi:hypothetical protein CG51_08400 [Haematobacter missouriensis]|uniref:DnaA N-terminal domain-containing protein n=1 Tax=Haematobacter missouriensis TaxID=366616 RepID=A0A212AHF2_9RHOB|nr:DnaA N-terminal domain-containing protein [Haematobacter missouriensis]KFI28302.1 hypothetical protein CG51_08400 [Haematobacter missouriensis]OWJ74603.1 hypothetical protein CDV53_13075 [Haematobacter missouriensis]OWJ80833.1 hypothetical protein CDV52_20865 [Haematobacter missouriensis]